MTEEPGPADRSFLRQAIELSRRCPPSDTAFSVGAILVGGSGEVIATGYSRERENTDHAEQVALVKATGLAAPGPEPVPADATLYTSLEPCLRRVSQPLPCARLIVDAGIGRVVLAWREPPLFMPGGGADWLREQGVTVVEFPDLAEAARAVNARLLAR